MWIKLKVKWKYVKDKLNTLADNIIVINIIYLNRYKLFGKRHYFICG